MENQQFNIGYQCSRAQCDSGKSEKIAMRFIKPGLSQIEDYSFRDLEEKSNRFANGLIYLGFSEGDIIFSLIPKMPETFFVFLGILKIKAIAGMLYSSFGDEALKDRLIEANGVIVKKSQLKKIEKITNLLSKIKNIIVIDLEEDRAPNFVSYQRLIEKSSAEYTCSITSTNAPSVLHYTSGSTGKPKGVLHVHGSILEQTESAVEVLKLNDQETYWCTADQGWITGTSYGIIAPWSLGVTQIHYGGGFNPVDWFRILESQQVSIWYTAPTALRMLMQQPDDFFKEFDLSKLKYIFSVGEPLNPQVIDWSRRVLKHEIYDTWFQTETGSIMIANKPGQDIKSGSMGKPVSGITVNILDEDQISVPVNSIGNLCIKKGWPSMFVDYLHNTDFYLTKFIGDYYYSGDQAYVDEEGYYWFIGRNDDVINTSGHLVSPFEVESALLELSDVAESAVVGVPDDLLFEKVVAFIVLKTKQPLLPEFEIKMKLHILNRISSLAVPTEIICVDSIPKNKSGKIMRRVLKATYLNKSPGDISTMEDMN